MKLAISMIFNVLIVGCTVYVRFWWLNIMKSDKPKEIKRKEFYRYFTTNSNVLSAFASAVVLIYEIVGLISGSLSFSAGRIPMPQWLVLLRFAGSSSVAVTFLTVVFFLAPKAGWEMLYKDDNLYMHLLGPLMAIAAFIFEDGEMILSLGWAFLGFAIVLIYAIIYLIQVVQKGEENGGWPDFYFFNVDGKWKISFTAMLLAGALISIVLIVTRNLFI